MNRSYGRLSSHRRSKGVDLKILRTTSQAPEDMVTGTCLEQLPRYAAHVSELDAAVPEDKHTQAPPHGALEKKPMQRFCEVRIRPETRAGEIAVHQTSDCVDSNNSLDASTDPDRTSPVHKESAIGQAPQRSSFGHILTGALSNLNL